MSLAAREVNHQRGDLMRITKTILITTCLFILEAALPAIAVDSNWTITGQVRPRFEYRNGYRQLLPPATTDGVVFISQRTRIGVLYTGEAKARAFVQVQDVRTWGDETHTSTDATADKFDLHQGYLDVMPNEHWTLRIGRQEIAYDEDRLLGTGNWNQSGRSHDAIRVMWQSGKTSIHGAWAHHERGEPVSWTTYHTATNYQDLAFLRISHSYERGSGSAMVVFDAYETRAAASTPARWTGGVYGTTKLAGFNLRGESYCQIGQDDGHGVPVSPEGGRLDIRAYMAGLSITRKLGHHSGTLWYDYLSGDSDNTDDRFESFNPLYGTFHRFYGWADYFISFPGDIRGLGLQDLAMKFEIFGPSIAKTQVDLHYFWLAEKLPTFNVHNKHLGFEADFMVTIPILKTVSLTGGASLVLPTETMRTLKGQADQGHWVWTMLDFNVK